MLPSRTRRAMRGVNISDYTLKQLKQCLKDAGLSFRSTKHLTEKTMSIFKAELWKDCLDHNLI